MMTSLHHICNTLAQWLNGAELEDPDWSPELWESLKFISRVHGTAPLLHKRLYGVTWLDSALKGWLAEQYRFNDQRIAKMQVELKEILASFSQAGIGVMPLKGAILAVEYYEAAGLRPMADLDLLIQPEDFERGAAVLAQLGYEQDLVHWKHTEFIKPDNRRVVSTQGEHPDNPRGVEVHLHCRETFGGPTIELTDFMWRHSVEGPLLGERAILPAPEALWLHLVVHASYHLWQGRGRLIHLVDLVHVSPQLTDLQSLLSSVDARFTYPSLAMVKKYFPGSIEDRLLSAQADRLSPSFRQWADTLDLVNSSYLNPKPQGLYLLKALKFSEGRPREMIQTLRFALLPRLEEIALDHPRLARSGAPWLAYLLLPWDWVRRLKSSKLRSP